MLGVTLPIIGVYLEILNYLTYKKIKKIRKSLQLTLRFVINISCFDDYSFSRFVVFIR